MKSKERKNINYIRGNIESRGKKGALKSINFVFQQASIVYRYIFFRLAECSLKFRTYGMIFLAL